MERRRTIEADPEGAAPAPDLTRSPLLPSLSSCPEDMICRPGGGLQGPAATLPVRVPGHPDVEVGVCSEHIVLPSKSSFTNSVDKVRKDR